MRLGISYGPKKPRTKFTFLHKSHCSSWGNSKEYLIPNLKLDRSMPLICIALLSNQRTHISSFLITYNILLHVKYNHKSEHYLASQTISVDNHLNFIPRLY